MKINFPMPKVILLEKFNLPSMVSSNIASGFTPKNLHSALLYQVSKIHIKTPKKRQVNPVI